MSSCTLAIAENTTRFSQVRAGSKNLVYSRAPADNIETDSDLALIQATLSQDDKAFERLMGRYQTSVARILWHFTRDPLVLQELVQDTFVELYFSLHRFRQGAPFYPWLRTVATRVGYRSWRKNRRESDLAKKLAALRDTIQDTTADSASDTANYVYGVLEQLKKKDRLILTLQYFEGCSTRDIAERMGWSISAVKVRAFRARRKLRALLVKMEQDSYE